MILNLSQACRSHCLEMRLPAGHAGDRSRRNSPFKLASCYTISQGYRWLASRVAYLKLQIAHDLDDRDIRVGHTERSPNVAEPMMLGKTLC